MVYVGIVIDQLYTDGSFMKDNMIAAYKSLCEPICPSVNTLKMPRIYSDEVTLCSGLPAFNRMEKAFKAKWLSKWEAWRAWRRLV